MRVKRNKEENKEKKDLTKKIGIGSSSVIGAGIGAASGYGLSEIGKERVGKKRDDLPWVENELNPEFEQYVIESHEKGVSKIYELLNKYNDKEIIIFKTRNDSEDFLNNLKFDIVLDHIPSYLLNLALYLIIFYKRLLVILHLI